MSWSRPEVSRADRSPPVVANPIGRASAMRHAVYVKRATIMLQLHPAALRCPSGAGHRIDLLSEQTKTPGSSIGYQW